MVKMADQEASGKIGNLGGFGKTESLFVQENPGRFDFAPHIRYISTAEFARPGSRCHVTVPGNVRSGRVRKGIDGTKSSM